MQHIVRHGKGIGECGLLVGDPKQILVRDHDQGVDEGLQLFNAALGREQPLTAFKLERLGHHTHGQNALGPQGFGDNRRGAGAGAAAHAGGDKGHVGTRHMIENLINGFFRRCPADIGTGATAQTLGNGRAQLDAAVRRALRQGLGVRVGDNELDPFQAGRDHVVDGIAAGTADADDNYTRL